jgi:hypothetical protein
MFQDGGYAAACAAVRILRMASQLHDKRVAVETQYALRASQAGGTSNGVALPQMVQ